MAGSNFRLYVCWENRRTYTKNQSAGICKEKIAVFKPQIDNRYSDDSVVSHAGSSVKSFNIKNAREIFDYIDDSYDVIAIDEVQFFDEEIVDICDYFADQGKESWWQD